MKSKKPSSADVHPGPGFRIRQDFERLNGNLIKRFQDFDVPDISDALNRLYALDPAIKCQTQPNHRLCGSVCTVRVFPGDNLMVHKILDIAKVDDIVVVAAHGLQTLNAVLGDIVSMKAKHRGIAGFVVDGLVRDLPKIKELDFPVFARGATTFGPLHRGPGEINYPISCGGVVINPGDLMVADSSGIVVIPRENAEETILRLEADRVRQQTYLEAVQRGEFSNEWVDQLLMQHGCQTCNFN
jgi:regulator of RNase E activity RraA